MLSVICLSANAEGPATKPRVSTFAPSTDIEQQITLILSNLDKNLATAATYSAAKQEATARASNALVVVALAAGLDDKKNKHQNAAPAMMKTAGELADAVEDYDQAKAALNELHASLKTQGDPSKLTWQPVADLAMLMNYVPTINNGLKRGVNSRRFEREADKAAGMAATLAIIAQASAGDTDYCSDQEDEATWRELCGELRDGAAALNQAIRDNDQEKAKQKLKALSKSCDACHEQFR